MYLHKLLLEEGTHGGALLLSPWCAVNLFLVSEVRMELPLAISLPEDLCMIRVDSRVLWRKKSGSALQLFCVVRAGYMKGCCSLMGLVVLCSVSDVCPHCCTWTGVQCVEDCLATLQLYWNRTNVGRWKKAVAKSYVSLLTEAIHLPLVCVCHLGP